MSSGTRIPFRGTTIAVATAQVAVPGSITAITIANPPVISQAAHGLVDRDIVYISGIVGTTELNNQFYVVDSVTAGTYSLQGINALDYAAWVSGGTVTKSTMTKFCNLTSYSADTGTTSETSVETVCSTEIEADFGLPDPGSVSIGYNLDEGTAVQIALENSRKTVTPIPIKITYTAASGGRVMVDIGVVTQTGVSGAAGTPNWTGTATIRRTRGRLDAVVTP